MANVISTDKAPAAIGPYSQAIEVNGMIYTSGMIPIDPSTGELVTGSVEAQAEQAISNLEALLAASGSSIEKAVKTVVLSATWMTLERSMKYMRNISKSHIRTLLCSGCQTAKGRSNRDRGCCR